MFQRRRRRRVPPLFPEGSITCCRRSFMPGQRSQGDFRIHTPICLRSIFHHHFRSRSARRWQHHLSGRSRTHHASLLLGFEVNIQNYTNLPEKNEKTGQRNKPSVSKSIIRTSEHVPRNEAPTHHEPLLQAGVLATELQLSRVQHDGVPPSLGQLLQPRLDLALAVVVAA